MRESRALTGLLAILKKLLGHALVLSEKCVQLAANATGIGEGE